MMQYYSLTNAVGKGNCNKLQVYYTHILSNMNFIRCKHNNKTVQRGFVLDALLLVVFLTVGIIGNSRFSIFIGGWFGHMVFTVIILFILSFRGLWFLLLNGFDFAPSHQSTYILTTACIWATLCCIAQPNAYANLAVLGVYILNIYVCLYIAPNLIIPYFGQKAILLYILPLFIAVVMCIITSGGEHYRVRGISQNATHAATVATIATIVSLWMSLSWVKSRYVWLCFCLVSLVLLIMTRTRATICACFVGSLSLTVMYLRITPKIKIKHLLIALFFFVILVFCIAILWNPTTIPELRTYFRVSNSEEIFQSRWIHWKDGINQAINHPIFGNGPMAKFGNSNDITVNTYTMEDCYCNTWLTFAQAYGIPGSMLFAIWFWVLLSEARSGYGFFSILAFGILTAFFTSTIGDMWGVSFGNEGDRAMWLILGISCAKRKHCYLNVR